MVASAVCREWCPIPPALLLLPRMPQQPGVRNLPRTDRPVRGADRLRDVGSCLATGMFVSMNLLTSRPREGLIGTTFGGLCTSCWVSTSILTSRCSSSSSIVRLTSLVLMPILSRRSYMTLDHSLPRGPWLADLGPYISSSVCASGWSQEE